MTSNRTIRLYAFAASLLVLFLTWAAIVAHPWRSATAVKATDARLVALGQREQLLRRDMALVQKIATRAAVAPAPVAAPAVRVVTLPPLVITRTS